MRLVLSLAELGEVALLAFPGGRVASDPTVAARSVASTFGVTDAALARLCPAVRWWARGPEDCCSAP